MSQELRARRWLRLDAVYCGAVAILALALAAPFGRLFHVPWVVVAAVGAATFVWACLLAMLSRRPAWRQPTTIVCAANAAASVGVAALAVISPAAASQLLLGAVAVEVAAFAIVQIRVLRHSASK
jgi:hypothetical protein